MEKVHIWLYWNKKEYSSPSVFISLVNKSNVECFIAEIYIPNLRLVDVIIELKFMQYFHGCLRTLLSTGK